MILELEALWLVSGQGRARRPLLRGVTLGLAAGESLAVLGETGSGRSLIRQAALGSLPGGIEIAGGRVLFQGGDFAATPPARRRALVRQAIAGVGSDAPPAHALLWLAEDPGADLEPVPRLAAWRALRAAQLASGAALLLLTNDVTCAAILAQRTVVLQAGRILEAGPTTELLAAPTHSYTQALLQAVPHPDRAAPQPLPGHLLAVLRTEMGQHDERHAGAWQ